MKKLQVFGISLFFLFLLSISLVSAVRINEVMHHTNNSFGDEWIELYNSENSPLMLIDWRIGDKVSNDTINLNISSNGFAIITDSSIGCSSFNISDESCIELSSIGSGLNDDDETIYLYNESLTLIDNFSWNKSIKSSGNSWQFCNENWIETEPTPGSVNLCEEENGEDDNGENGDGGDGENQTEPEIYLEADWDKDDIINGEEFEIEVKAFNLKNGNYSVKAYITFEDNDTVISDRYDEENEEWKSGRYYVDNFFSGPGNKSKDITLRIRDNYREFFDDAILKIKIENEDYIFEENIVILEKKDEENPGEEEEEGSEVDNIGLEQTSNKIIKLNTPKNIKTQNSDETYKSKTQYIKKYGIYGFALFCVFIIILLIVERKWKKK